MSSPMLGYQEDDTPRCPGCDGPITDCVCEDEDDDDDERA